MQDSVVNVDSIEHGTTTCHAVRTSQRFMAAIQVLLLAFSKSGQTGQTQV